ncbi:MAG: FAD-dependent oxidoreductase [Actinomycetota bacterium]
MSGPVDVAIVGAGPAGLFAARELARHGKSVIVFEKGPDLEERLASPSSRASGFGGAGAYSDGKLTLSRAYGGWLGEYLPGPDLDRLIGEVDAAFCELGAPDEVYGLDESFALDLARRASLADLTYHPAPIRHVGTERLPRLLSNLRDQLAGVELRTGVCVEALEVKDGRIRGVVVGGELVQARCVIAAPGRDGANWLDSEARRLGLTVERNLVDVGVRLECPAVILEPLTKPLYEAKLVFSSRTFQDSVRTFCVCPYGEVAVETYEDVITVNGHSYAERRTANTNFALLVTTRFTEPFHEPIAYGRHLARLANMISGGILVQRLGDLKDGKRSTPERMARGTVVPSLACATPGDLAFALPHRYLVDILEMITALDRLAPGLDSRNTLLYGIEVKFYSARLRLDSGLQTEVEGLYGAGDGAGVSRGLVQAAASGILAARAVLRAQDPSDALH